MSCDVSHDVIALLEADPDLGRGLDGARLASARREARAAVLTLGRGPWDPDGDVFTLRHGFGLLMLDGVIVRRIGPRRRGGAELLGPGDLMRPWDADADAGTLTSLPTTWRVIEPARLAVLDQRFAARVAAYPEIAARLMQRGLERARAVLVQMAIAHHARIDDRLALALWHLADRWGRVTPNGVAISLRLTHELLADLVAAQRPSVTLSLQHLERDGRIARRDSSIFLLGDPPDLDGMNSRENEYAEAS
jgi:CRP/FNR family transcriptional regulator, cyclic AMP receptor protein